MCRSWQYVNGSFVKGFVGNFMVLMEAIWKPRLEFIAFIRLFPEKTYVLRVRRHNILISSLSGIASNVSKSLSLPIMRFIDLRLNQADTRRFNCHRTRWFLLNINLDAIIKYLFGKKDCFSQMGLNSVSCARVFILEISFSFTCQ
jgi:hypothetical protein